MTLRRQLADPCGSTIGARPSSDERGRHEQESAPARTVTDGRSDPQCVLVGDDDEGVRALTAVVLRRAGFQVIEAASGTAPIDIIAAQRVGVVVCDLAMPGMSGLDLIRAIRHRPETATLPVLLVTGSGDDRSVIEGLDAGADDFLSKPVRLDELV